MFRAQPLTLAAGKGRIPSDEDEIASDLYIALQAFFEKHMEFGSRPFVISGESYAGKYVPKIGVFLIPETFDSPVSIELLYATINFENALYVMSGDWVIVVQNLCCIKAWKICYGVDYQTYQSVTAKMYITFGLLIVLDIDYGSRTE